MTTTRLATVCLVALVSIGCDNSGAPLPSAPSAVVPVVNPQPVVNVPSVPAYVPDAGLSGVVYEITAAGLRPLEGVTIYCDACGEYGHTWAYTNSTGSYTFTEGLWLTSGPTALHIEKDGYDDPPGQPALLGFRGAGWRAVMIKGDTQFDMQLVRR